MSNTMISIYLIVLFTLRIFFGFLSSSALTILINISCKIRERGKMNGLTLIFQSLSQALGPIILGTSMSLSLHYDILSHELCFVVLLSVNIFACYIDTKLDFP